MKIFIGGMKEHHQRAFASEFPDVDLAFATFTDHPRKWLSAAARSDIVIVDQSRCSHTITDILRKNLRTHIYFTDSKAHMREIIKEATANGKVGYRYT